LYPDVVIFTVTGKFLKEFLPGTREPLHSGSRGPAHPIAAPLVSANPSNSRLSSRDAVRCVRPSAASVARRAVPAVSYTADTSSARSAAAVRAKSAVYRAAGRASISAANWRVTSRVRGRRAVDPVPTGLAAAIHALDSAVNRASRCVASVNNRYTHTHTHTPVQRPFVRDYPGGPVPER